MASSKWEMKQFHHSSGRSFAVALKKYCHSESGELTMTIFLRDRERCFVVDSKERGHLGQAVEGLSVAMCTVNKDAGDHGTEAVKEKG